MPDNYLTLIREFLFVLIGLGMVVLLLRLIVRHKGPLTPLKSFQFGLIILIVIILLLLFFQQ